MYNKPIFQCCDGLLLFVRFLGNETSPESFLLHNALARKPKRIRTAFSPSQLLRLEHAFEKNHYVVGAERKQLAHSLSLTETQVRNTNQSSQHYSSTPPCFFIFSCTMRWFNFENVVCAPCCFLVHAFCSSKSPRVTSIFILGINFSRCA